MTIDNRRIKQLPSETALFTALRRTIAHQEYHDERFGPDGLAEIFLPAHYRFFLRFAKVRANTKQKLAAFMPGLNEYIIARTAFFDGLFVSALKVQVPQIVLLGAGYDSRAVRFASLNRRTRIFELDAAPTQNRKIKCLKAARVGIPDGVQFVPIDFTVDSLGDVLAQAGYQHQARALFLWEGVSYYLSRQAVAETLCFVGCAHRESAIAFDYAITVTAENVGEVYGASELMESMKEHHEDEALEFSLQEGEIEPFLEGLNLRLVEHLDREAIERKFLMDASGALIGRMAGNFRFVCAALLN